MIGRVIDDRYRIHSLIAVGEQGRVYEAEQFVLGRTVAIKVLAAEPARPPPDRPFHERFMAEAARASLLTSPTTITIFDYGRTDDGFHYLVMEYVDGITLARCLERARRIPILPAVTIVGQVCLSLREAHARGVLHLAIKPSNIMLVDRHHDQIKVLDYGIARQLDAADLGVPEYMAPESLDGPADTRSDIYSVGVVLYRLLTGRVPFRGETASRTLLMAARDPVPPIDPQIGVPHAIEQIVMACLEKDRERRPPSVDDVLFALQVGVLEMHAAAQAAPAPHTTELHAMVEPAADEVIAEDPPSAGPATPVPAPAWQARALIKALVAGAVLFSVGAAVSLIVRFAVSDRDAAAPAPPAARPARVAPAAGSSAQTPPTSPAPAPVANPDTRATPPSAPELVNEVVAEEDDEVDEDGSRRRPRGAERKRTASDGRAPSAPSRSDRERDRDPSQDRQDRQDRRREPIPEGYKDSPY